MSSSLFTPPRTEGPRGLLDQLLHEQQLLTPVAEFARQYERGEIEPGANRFRDLLPLTPPATGEQYAFEVELDKCSGCKACVTACHSLNGLDDNETWREVGLLIDAPKKKKRPASGAIPLLPYGASSSRDSGSELLSLAHQGRQQHVTSACHHCVDPACLNGCPVLAYEKDSVTGIVRHLDDQCIGCQYCILKCPYDVPKYNARLGIVRKCDMCSSRLAVGEAPACVQACPTEAIRITKVEMESVRIEFHERRENFLSGAPAGEYTLPTTRYLGVAGVGRGVLTAPRHESENNSKLSNTSPRRAEDRAPYLVAADAAMLHPQPPHWPLVFMLVLSQASVGAMFAAILAGKSFELLWLALASGVASIVASVFHLGRPLGAWRFFLGLRRSWMSREILMFTLFVPLVAGSLAMEFTAQTQTHSVVSGIAAGFGLLGVFCSIMIYHDTRRVLWHWRRSAIWFFGSTLTLGWSAWIVFHSVNAFAFSALVLVVAVKLASEFSVLRHVTDDGLTSLKKSALLITGRFQPVALSRMLCAVIGGIGLPLLLHIGAFASGQTALAWIAFALLLAGEILERMLFFRAVDAPKMPGGLHA